jgi:glutathione synthase
VKLAFVADPLDSFKIYKDTTFAMMREAAARGHALYALEQGDLVLRGGVVEAHAYRVHLTGEKQRWYRAEDAGAAPLRSYDAVLMRKDPPFDMEYVYSTYLLELAEVQGTRVFNRPRAIRDWNEKLGAARFPQFTPPTLVTRREAQVREFLAEHRDVILKPLDGMGGASVFRVRENDPNVGVIIETVMHHGGRTIMAQRFIPEIRDGDKRVLLIGGKPVPHALARIPKPGETRGNLAAGANGVARELTRRDREIAETLAPALQKEGLLLVGLDVIGDWLTEVNVTSPTCFQEITEQSGFNVAGMFMDALERELAAGR